MKIEKSLKAKEAFDIAWNLKSDKSNPEYDRALVEFLYDAYAFSREVTAKRLGISFKYIYPEKHT